MLHNSNDYRIIDIGRGKIIPILICIMELIVMEKKVVNKNKVNTKAEMVNDIENILEGLRGKSVVCNVGGSVSFIKTLNNFDFFWDSKDKRVLALEDRDDKFEQDIFLNTKDFRNYYFDAFNVEDNLNINMKSDAWIQIYEQ
jgi:hypothetical protein